jgi:hypothetical protein
MELEVDALEGLGLPVAFVDPAQLRDRVGVQSVTGQFHHFLSEGMCNTTQP